MSKKLIHVALLMVAVVCTGWAHSRVPHGTRADLGQDLVPTPAVARATTFGFNALMADYYWLQAVQVAGAKDIVDHDTAEHLGKVIDVVTTLNPHVDHPYRFAAIWLNFDEDQVREGIRLLDRAVENHPDDWRNYFYLGFNHFFYLGEHAKAADVLETAMNLPGSPAYLARLVARLKSQHADIDVAEVFLRELLQTTADPDALAKIESALDEIEIEYKARHLDRAREAYRSLVGRDIEVVEDLISAPYRMLETLPNPEPEALPASLTRGSVWEIDPRSGRITSSFLGSRYEIYYSPMDRQRLEAWGKTTHGSDQGEEATRGDG